MSVMIFSLTILHFSAFSLSLTTIFTLSLLHPVHVSFFFLLLFDQSETMKPFVFTIVFFIFMFIGLSYREETSFMSSTSFLKLRTCSSNHSDSNIQMNKSAEVSSDEEAEEAELNQKDCNYAEGKWVFNISAKPLYSDQSCPYLDKQVSCVKNGRPDSDYRYWEWQPDNCALPRFDPRAALEKLRGKRLMFVGDSLQRGQWQSFVCMVESVLPEEKKAMKRGRSHSVFKAKEYNSTIEFYWAPFLVESNSDVNIIANPKDRVLRVDTVAKHARYWAGVDVLVFNTYIWWMNGLKIKSLWGSFSNGEAGYEELEAEVAYRIALKTWANWVDSTVDPNKTRVLFTTMSPTHIGSLDRHSKKGYRCYNETRPFRKYWGSGPNRKTMKLVESITDRMKVPVSFINITQMSELRIDGHASVYTEYQGKELTDAQKEDPKRYADCIHWCLPGVPDTWNQLFYTHL